TRLKPSFSRYGVRCAASRYCVTTREPGASEVLTHGLHWRPASTALRATNTAAIITAGFEVLVQLVMAAMTTEPCVTVVAARGWRRCSGGDSRISPAGLPPSPTNRERALPSTGSSA